MFSVSERLGNEVRESPEEVWRLRRNLLLVNTQLQPRGRQHRSQGDT